MLHDLLTTKGAAEALGISVPTLYDWLGQSRSGEFQLRGLPVQIEYYQSGRRGQGRIRIPEREVKRLLNLMKAEPRPPAIRRSPSPKALLQHITTTPGRPDD
ncbi:helix-turn-helix domain-containing protein [bacterium]|nr:helix-turn-helix domain-containing protein [bacterium]